MFFFFVSAAFWLLQSLNETFDVELKVPLKLENVPSDVVITSDLPSDLNVMVRDKGTVLVRYIYGTEQVPVRVDYKDYDKGNASGRVSVTLLDVQKKVQAQLLSSTRIVSLKPDTLEFFFNKGARKKVPVKLAGVVETSPEYYLQRVEFTPDSVEVLAPSAILDTITEAFITPVYFSDLSANEKTISMLRPVRGAKFIPDQVEMNVMIDLKTLFLIVLGIALLVLIVYLIQLTRKLLTSMDHTINILEDVATITDLAAKRSKDVDGIIGDVSESVESLSKAVKGDQNIFSAISSVIKAVAAVKKAGSKE